MIKWWKPEYFGDLKPFLNNWNPSGNQREHDIPYTQFTGESV